LAFNNGGGIERMRITSNGGVSFGASGTAYGSSGQVLVSNGDTAPTWGSAIVSGTAQATTSGTFKDFTSIPSWVKRITVMFNGVSTSGISAFLNQIGSGSVDSASYNSNSFQVYVATGTQVSLFTSTSGYIIANNVAANLVNGTMVLTTVGSNIWVASSTTTGTTGTPIGIVSAGSKTLSGALDRVRITTVNGTDTFDAGSINILYE
jgi:hypothetical protein